MDRLEHLKSILNAEGFTYAIRGSDEYDEVTVLVSVPCEPQELPDELKPFAWSEDQVERAIWKGNTTKQTFNGANLELALQNYAYSLLHADPETQTLEATLATVVDKAGLDAYDTSRKEIWNRIVSDPQIVAWEKHLETLY